MKFENLNETKASIEKYGWTELTQEVKSESPSFMIVSVEGKCLSRRRHLRDPEGVEIQHVSCLRLCERLAPNVVPAKSPRANKLCSEITLVSLKGQPGYPANIISYVVLYYNRFIILFSHK